MFGFSENRIYSNTNANLGVGQQNEDNNSVTILSEHKPHKILINHFCRGFSYIFITLT
jgi:hypothetical protein